MKVYLRAVAAAAAIVGAAACAEDTSRDDVVVLGATHTLEDAGVLDSLTAAFRRAHPSYTLRVVVHGTREALELARRGDVDVVLSHAPAAEQRAVQRGDVADRTELMYNRFVIVGPAADPAGAGSQTSAAAALAAIAAAGAPFVTRDDSSGTHMRELELWEAGEARPPRGPPYVRAGGGMADALRIADQRKAYTLSDTATFAALQRTLDLVFMFGNDDSPLRNSYAVMMVPRARNPDAGRVLHAWLAGDSARAVIERFGHFTVIR